MNTEDQSAALSRAGVTLPPALQLAWTITAHGPSAIVNGTLLQVTRTRYGSYAATLGSADLGAMSNSLPFAMAAAEAEAISMLTTMAAVAINAPTLAGIG